MSQAQPEDDFPIDHATYQRLCEYARRVLGSRNRSGQVGFETDSVVLSAIRGEIGRGKVQDLAQDDAHLQALLCKAIAWKILRRIARHRAASPLVDVVADAPEADDPFREPLLAATKPLSGAGQSGQAGQEQQAIEQERQRERIVARLSAACRDDRQRLLLEGRLLQDPPRPWEEIAAAIGCSKAAAKTAMSRLKPKLAVALADPLREQVTGEQWTLLRHLVIRRESPSVAAAAMGMEPDDIRAMFEDELFPRLCHALGPVGMAFLWELHRGAEHRPRPAGT